MAFEKFPHMGNVCSIDGNRLSHAWNKPKSLTFPTRTAVNPLLFSILLDFDADTVAKDTKGRVLLLDGDADLQDGRAFGKDS